MPNSKVQVKFTIDSDTAASFKARCAAKGVSMASVISQWMKSGRPTKTTKMPDDTRPHRKRTVLEITARLEELLRKEEEYRDAIPEQFESRYESSCLTCDKVGEAICCLEEAF